MSVHPLVGSSRHPIVRGYYLTDFTIALRLPMSLTTTYPTPVAEQLEPFDPAELGERLPGWPTDGEGALVEPYSE